MDEPVLCLGLSMNGLILGWVVKGVVDFIVVLAGPATAAGRANGIPC